MNNALFRFKLAPNILLTIHVCRRPPKTSKINKSIGFSLGQSVDSLNSVAAVLPQVTCTMAYSWKYSAIVCLAGVITATPFTSGCVGASPSSALVQPSVHWLGGAEAAQHSGRGALGPGDQVTEGHSTEIPTAPGRGRWGILEPSGCRPPGRSGPHVAGPT